MQLRKVIKDTLRLYEETTGTPLILLQAAIQRGDERNRRRRERYAASPQAKITQQLAWNRANPEKKAASDKRWRQKYGAEATRRFRERQKEKA